MAIQYQPPGVLNVIQQSAAPISVNVAFPSELPCIMGSALGYESQLDTITAGTAPVVLSQTNLVYANLNVPQQSVTVYNPALYATIGPGNYYLTTTGGTTSLGVVTYPGTPTLALGANGSNLAANIQYKYSVTFLVNAGGTTTAIYETGGLPGTVINTGSTALASINLSNLSTTNTAAGSAFTVVGRNVYRAEYNTTTNAYGPYYQLTAGGGTVSGWAGSVSITDATTSTYSDTNTDASILNNPIRPNRITVGDTLQVSYNFTGANYYLPIVFSAYADIEATYGPAFDSNGYHTPGVTSDIALGAKLAMLNGASRVVCLAVSPSDNNWGSAFTILTSDLDSTIIVPMTGNPTIQQAAVAHCANMQNQNVFRTTILGADGVAAGGTITPTLMQSYSSGINQAFAQYVDPSIFRYYNTVLGQEVALGGQYAAAALAGMHAARGPSDSLTRQTVVGFSSIGQALNQVTMNADAQAGLTVIEQRTGQVRVRHDISTAPGDVNTREFPVTLQTNNMLRNIIAIYDTNIIGQMKSNAVAIAQIQSVTQTFLNNLVSTGALDSFNGLSVQISPSDPTQINIQWSFRPVYTVLYIQITIGLNISSGTNTVSTATAPTNTLL